MSLAPKPGQAEKRPIDCTVAEAGAARYPEGAPTTTGRGAGDVLRAIGQIFRDASPLGDDGRPKNWGK